MKTKIAFLSLFILFLNYQIYSQWKAEGVVIVDTSANLNAEYPIFPILVDDGSGGAVICWHDNRFGDKYLDIYAQRIDNEGKVRWKKNGIPICSYVYRQQFPQICRDNNNNFFISWQDGRDAVYFYPAIQKIDINGNILWKENGIRLSGQRGLDNRIVPDYKGGVYIAYTLPYDNEDFKAKVICQRLGSNGEKLFGDTGIVVCKKYGLISTSEIAATSDNNGGIIIAWNLNNIIIAQRINSEGKKLWGNDGQIVGYSSGGNSTISVIGNLDGSAFIKWSYTYEKASVNNKFEFVNKVSSDGIVLLGFGGIKISDVEEYSYDGVKRFVSDGNNGFYFTHSLFLQKFNENVKPQWPSNAIPFYNLTNISDANVINSNNEGVYIFGQTSSKIYAQYFDKNGGRLFSNNGLLVYSSPSQSIYKLNCISDGADGVILTWRELSSIKAIKINKNGVINKINFEDNILPITTKLYQNYPNPFNPVTSIKYDLSNDDNIKIIIYDLLGREAKVVYNGFQKKGSYIINIDCSDISSGVYFYKLITSSYQDSRSMVLTK
jgi:hypothetical protein